MLDLLVGGGAIEFSVGAQLSFPNTMFNLNMFERVCGILTQNADMDTFFVRNNFHT